MPKQRYKAQIAPQGFVTAPSDYDGTNDFQTRGGDLTGAADGKAGTFSAWINLNGGDSVGQTFFANITNPFSVNRNATNFLTVVGKNTSNTTILNLTSISGIYVSSFGWIHLLASWDLATGVGYMFVNDVSALSGSPTLTNDTIDYTHSNWVVGASTAGGAAKCQACIAELFFHTTYIDLSIIYNRRKFRSQFGRPVYLGADGSAPLGVQPLVYAPNGDASTNLGSGGNFTTTGALTACGSAP